MTRAARLGVSPFCFLLLFLTAARAETVADFYRGKTIELAIAGAPAGGYDVAARTLANSLQPAHPRKSHRHRQEHAGRSRPRRH